MKKLFVLIIVLASLCFSANIPGTSNIKIMIHSSAGTPTNTVDALRLVDSSNTAGDIACFGFQSLEGSDALRGKICGGLSGAGGTRGYLSLSTRNSAGGMGLALLIDDTKNITLPILAGTGVRYVTASASGGLSTATGLSTTLTAAHILLGNGSNVATDVAISGDVAIDNAGLTTIGTYTHDLLFTDATYDIGKTGATRPRDFFLSRNGVIGGTLNVTGAITGTLTGNASTVTTNANLTGPITSSGNATSIASQTGTGTTFAMSAGPTFTGTLAAATGTYSGTLAVTGTSQFTGVVGIGVAPSTDVACQINYTMSSSATDQYGFFNRIVASSSATNSGNGGYLQVRSAAASYHMKMAYGLEVGNPVAGSTSTIDTAVGVHIEAQTTGATKNYAIETLGGKNFFGDTVVVAGKTAVTSGGATVGIVFGSSGGPQILFGSGAPTVSAPKGSLYLRTDGTTTNDRAYINTNGTTTWTALTTGA